MTRFNNTRHAASAYLDSLPTSKDEVYLQECLLEFIAESNEKINEYNSGPEEMIEVWVRPILALLPYFIDNKFLIMLKDDLYRCLNVPKELEFYNSTVKNELEKIRSKMILAIEGLKKVSVKLNKEYAPLVELEAH